jgi:hypothetical protein
LNGKISELEVKLNESTRQNTDYLNEKNTLADNVGRLEKIISELNETIVN